MYPLRCDDKRHSLPANQGMPTMGAPYNTAENFDPQRHYELPAQQRRIGQNSNRSSELSHVPQPKSFTYVTAMNRERSMSRHRTLKTTHFHHVSETGGQRGDTVRSSPDNIQAQCATQHKHVSAHTYYKSFEPTRTIYQTRISPPMLWDAETYPSWGYQCQPDWAAYQVADQNYDLHHDEAYSGSGNSLRPYVQEHPPTPALTIRVDEISRKSSLASNKSQGSSPRGCKPGFRSRTAACAVSTSAVANRGDDTGEQLHENSLLTPLSEEAAVPQDTHAQPGTEQLLSKPDIININQDGDFYYRSPLPTLENNPDLNLSSEWDPLETDFLDDANEFAPGFMADQVQERGFRQDEWPSAYPALPLDPIFPSGSGAELSHPPVNITFPSDILDARFDQYAGYEPAQHPAFATTGFQDHTLDFNPNSFSSQLATTSRENDKTSNRSQSKDQLLVDLKRRGYSYKDIKAMGNFEEAESTLRGRFRTLTKPKEARVRKPEWGDREIQLLFEAVDTHTNAMHNHQHENGSRMSRSIRRANKIPWKQVAEYMAHRGAYKYGNATVKKKWSEVMEARQTSC